MPPGIPFIVGNELAERFSFYGMRSILFAYMTLYLCQPNGSNDCFGEKEAEAWVHLFVGSAYFFPVLGGFLSDALWGKYRTILVLSLAYCLGHGLLACMELFGDTRTLLLLGLGLIAIGAGGIKPCVSAHVGDQFGAKNRKYLPKVFGWFSLSINLGAFLSGFLTPFLLEARLLPGTLGEQIYPLFSWLIGERQNGERLFGHHYAFGIPGILMGFATLIFWMGRHRYAHVPPVGKSYLQELRKRENLSSLAGLWKVFTFMILFWALFDQVGTLWQTQCREMNRTLPDWLPFFGGMEMLAAQVSAVCNPLFILLLIPFFSLILYPFLGRFIHLTELRKLGFGLWMMALAFGIASIAQECIEAGISLHVGWQILACLVLTASEVLVSITCLEFAYTQAPKSMKSLVMSMFLLTVSLGNFFASAVKFLLSDESGRSKLAVSGEFWFWTILMSIGASLFFFVARNHELVDFLHEEEEKTGG